MPKLPCLDCGVLSDQSRCAVHRRKGPRPQYAGKWQSLRAEVVRRAGRCEECGWTGSPTNPLTADHIVPVVQGGTSELTNLRCLCRDCNSKKSAIDKGRR